MKILEVIPTLHFPGGAQTFVASLATSFSKVGNISVDILSLYKERGLINEELEQKKIRIHYLNKKPGLDLRASRDFKKIVERLKPDVIHVHLASIVTLFFSGLLFKRKTNYRVFYTFHTLASKDTKKIATLLLKILFKNNLVIPIGISDFVSITIKERFGLRDVSTIYNGIDTSRYACDIELSRRSRDFIHVGSFTNVKNHRFLIESFFDLIKQCPNSNLTLVGDGPLFESVKERVSFLKLDNHVSFVGIRNDVNVLLREHKFFLLPSLYEGNPISILEAMAAGLPVIASKTGGIVDIIDNQKNGFLFPVNDKDEFVNHMKYLLDNPGVSQTISLENMSASRRFDIAYTTKQHLNLFAQHIKK